MTRGTTPTHTFRTKVDLREVDRLYITYSQNGRNVLEKTLEDCTITENTIQTELTQAETLRFDDRSDAPVLVQVRARFPNGRAMASKMIRTTADKILKDGEI